MKRYIKVNAKKEIIDLFFEVWKDRFDGTEIYLDDKDFPDAKINGKYISNDYGASIFEYKNGKITERKKSDIDKDEKTIAYNLKKVEEEKEVLINEKIKQIAIEALEAEGKL